MADAAKDFCRLIEHVLSGEDRRWVVDMAAVLSRINRAMIELAAQPFGRCCSDLPDLDEKFDFFCRLKRRFGDHDAYRMKDDSGDGEEEMTGSLADDLTDIYFELRPGLKRLEAETASQEDVLKGWQRGYALHWGERLVLAQRHLSTLQEAAER